MSIAGAGQELGLADEYDCVCVGTAIALTAISSALSQQGLKVLHLDNQEQYGSRDGTVSLQQFLQPDREPDPHFAPATISAAAAAVPAANDDEVVLATDAPIFSSYHMLHAPDPTALPHSTHRHYLFDLRPQLLYSRGWAVQAMIDQQVSSYVDFMSVDVLSLASSSSNAAAPLRFHAVPTTRSQLFADQQLSGEEKHQLMRLLQAVMANQIPEQPCSFAAYLHSLHLSPRVSAIIQYIMAMDRAGADALDTTTAMQRMKLLLDSSGRYSSVGGALLSSQYGLAEVSSAFARSSAVHGAVFVLRLQPTSIATEQCHGEQSTDRKVHGVVLPGGQLIKAPCIVAEPRFLSSTPATDQKRVRGWLVASLILRHSLLATLNSTAINPGSSQLHIIPPNHPVVQNRYPIHIIEHRAGSGMLPNTSTHCVAQAMTVAHHTANEEVQRLLAAFVAENQEQVLYAATHVVEHDQSSPAATQPLIRGLHIAGTSSDASSDGLIEQAMATAQSITAQIFQQQQSVSTQSAASNAQASEQANAGAADELDELDAILS